MERAAPVRSSHTSTADLLAWPQPQGPAPATPSPPRRPGQVTQQHPHLRSPPSPSMRIFIFLPLPRCVPLLIDHKLASSVARSRRRLSGRWCSGVRSPRRRPTASPRGQIPSRSKSPLLHLLLAVLSRMVLRFGSRDSFTSIDMTLTLMTAPPGSRAPRPSGRR